MRTPRYQEIADALRHEIRRHTFPQDRLPSERELGDRFHVQRDTVRRALELLEAENTIRRDSRRGTFIVRQATPYGDLPLSSLPSGNLILAVRHGEEATSAAHILRGMTSVATELGLPVLWLDTLPKEAPAGGRLPSLDQLMSRRALGVALWPELPADRTSLQALRDTLPFVLLDRRVPGFAADFLGFADFRGGETITRHLLSLGHRSIGFLSSEPLSHTVQERVRGYRHALSNAGIAFRGRWELHARIQMLSDDPLLDFLDGDGSPLTAVVCANDTVAARLIGRLGKLRRRVPEDVAVTGFGNAMSPFLEGLGLTTMAQPFARLGEEAARYLLRRLLATPAAADAGREIELPMELTVRTSCGHGVLTPP
ncbi:MAG: GntR family transcriptional regulator [Capsulimonadales bacterium]|nr:GntR family transcriptional regulator [Capsulimonadales bacterium]